MHVCAIRRLNKQAFTRVERHRPAKQLSANYSSRNISKHNTIRRKQMKWGLDINACECFGRASEREMYLSNQTSNMKKSISKTIIMAFIYDIACVIGVCDICRSQHFHNCCFNECIARIKLNTPTECTSKLECVRSLHDSVLQRMKNV